MIVNGRKRITVYEHQVLRLHQQVGETEFDEPMLQALQAFYGEKGVPYFTLIHRGVKFCEYVGVIQVGQLTVEVLPKVDRMEQEGLWRDVLVGMLRAVGSFDIHAPSSSGLQLKPDSVLELYFGMFVNDMEGLLHRGLVKMYRKTEGNRTSLKGSIHFARHIQKNLVHQERFYVRHAIYDTAHELHRVLYKALLLLKKINPSAALQSRIGSLLLHFPEQQDLKVTEATFEKICLSRKTAPYRRALDIARLLLLNFHPDVRAGNRDVLALMFDMNLLWEQFIYVTLRKGLQRHRPGVSVAAQNTKGFWSQATGYRTTIRPDIILQLQNGSQVVLDTKWKHVQHYNPSSGDLQQLYVYHEYFMAGRVALVYPGKKYDIRKGTYLPRHRNDRQEKHCAVILLPVEQDVRKWQEQVFEQLMSWLDLKNEWNEEKRDTSLT